LQINSGESEADFAEENAVIAVCQCG